ncbi:MAG: FAD-dependent oxidoreductase [Clostridium sp.]|nr:FAD-dependent oxidoreductase [Clostridium sp.]
MIRLNQIKMPLSHTDKDLDAKIRKLLYLKKEDVFSKQIVKKSVDARKKPEIFIIYTIDVTLKDEARILEYVSRKNTGKVQIQKAEEQTYRFPEPGSGPLYTRPVIIGTGPAGLFCGYYLARFGYRPILLERGREAASRKKDVEDFWKNGVLAPDSNVQFGEGGAGTFSDGKLNTLIKDKYGRNKEVLKLLVEAGAPEEILYDAKPHIGTDILMRVVEHIRGEIISYGGEVRFESKVTDIVIEKEHIKEVVVNDIEHIATDIAVLAIGHSARDTFRMLYERHVPMEAKPFAVGLRVEHPRRMINQIQYGCRNDKRLPAASYKVSAQVGGRGVYSFCMCPGGYVVNASSEAGKLAVNGMSYSGRGGDNSNSAVIVTVTPDDFNGSHPLSGIAFQRSLEEKAYEIGCGDVPVETYGDFKTAVTGMAKTRSALLEEYPDYKPAIKGAYRMAPVHEILPEPLNRSFVEGMEQFDKMLPGFGDSGVYVSGVESRTSSPVRIPREKTGESKIKGLYPCGEGAGYAGGITSAAMDGILTAEKIAETYSVQYIP